MNRIIIKKQSVILFPIMLFLFIGISTFLNKGLITSDNDGFFYQLKAVSSSSDLGSLGLIHSLRYYLLYPFFIFDNSIYQSFIFFLYVSPIFLCKAHSLKHIGVMLLIFSLFFSYRTVLVMLSIYLLISHIFIQRRSKKVIIYSSLLSFLSTGCFLAFLTIFYCYKSVLVKDKKKRKYLTILAVVLIVGMSGSLLHKILFFSDPTTFGSASSANLSSLQKLNLDSILLVIQNMSERSILVESLNSSEKTSRLYVLIIEFAFIIINLLFRRDKISIIFLLLFLVGCFMEGLMVYSLLPSIFLLALESFNRKTSYDKYKKNHFLNSHN